MKTIKIILPVLFVLVTAFAARATVLFSDNLNYPNGLIETDGFWFGYSPSPVGSNTFVNNDLLDFTFGSGQDSVGAPGGSSYPDGFTNNSGTFQICSFTINVPSLPTASDYFVVLMQITNGVNDAADVCHIFATTKGTTIPGTYRLGLANFATSYTTAGTTNYPLDLATDVTYQVVFSWDANQVNPPSGLPGATLWINPSSINDFNVYATDSTTNTALQNTVVSGIGFSPYCTSQIGNINVGTGFSDVSTGIATNSPVIGVQPQGSTNLYTGDNTTLYVTASGVDPTYQWYSNNVAMVDDDVTIIGSTSNILNLVDLQASANYKVIVTDGGGSSTSAVANVSIDTTPTPPFFTLQPLSQTNSELSPVTLSAAANGTGPITYQWYFEADGAGSFSLLSGATGPTYNFTAGFANSGIYYVTATGADGSSNSSDAVVLVIPPQLQSIGSLHSYITNLSGQYNINGGQIFNVEGVVTTIGQIESKTVSEFFIQDSSGGLLVYEGAGNGPNVTPAPGTLVHVISPAESYYGELEMDPTIGAASNAVIVLSTNNPIPAPVPLNFNNIATNIVGNGLPQSAYATAIECSLVTMTNVYLYSSKTGTAVSGNWPVNGTKGIYAFQQPYFAGEPYIELFVYTYTNQYDLINTNYFGQPIPSHAYEITAPLAYFSPNAPEPYPTRFQDFVTSPVPAFSAVVAATNGSATVSWLAQVGSTYSVYSSTNLLGPWTQTFGLSYYPSTGSYTDTNYTSQTFYKVSSP